MRGEISTGCLKKPAVPGSAIEAVENIAAARGRSTAPSCALDGAPLWQVGEAAASQPKQFTTKDRHGKQPVTFCQNRQIACEAQPLRSLPDGKPRNRISTVSISKELLESGELVCRKKRP